MARAYSLRPLVTFLSLFLLLAAQSKAEQVATSSPSSSLLSPPSFALFTNPSQPPLRALLYIPSSPSTPPPPATPDLYSFAHRALHHRDLPLIAALGANAVFLSPHAWHETTSHSHFLSLCLQHNLSVAVPFLPSFPFPPSAYDVTDRRAAALQALEDRWRSVLRQYQSHPAVLMWVVADTPPFASASSSPASGPSPTAAHLLLCRRLMAARDAECRDRPSECHPLTSVLGDSPPSDFVTEPLSYLHSLSPPLDLYCLAYSQPVSALPSFLTAFLRHQRSHAASPSLSQHRPLLLLLSADAYDSRSASRNESMQSAHLMRLLRTLARYERKVLVGVLVSDWVDQWWRSDGFDRPRVDCLRGADSRGEEAGRALRERRRREGNNEQEVCGWETLRGRREDDDDDGFTSVAYAGITAHSLSSPHLCIVPQLAFFSLRSLWTGSALPSAREHENWCQHSAACCAVDANSHGWMLVAAMMAAILLLLAVHRCWRRSTDAADARRWAVIDSGQNCPPVVYVLPAALSDKLAGVLYERLLASRSASLASLPHLRLVHCLMTHLLSQALTRTATLSQALSVIHARMLASYRAWCCSRRFRPALSADCAPALPSASSLLSDICDYLLLWASCEQLRRVPALVCFAFHHRSSLDLPALLAVSTAAINSYQQSYDDVDTVYLSSPASGSPSSLLSLPSRLWSNHLQAFAYPLLGGWSALLHLVWPLLSFHVLLYVLLIATAREEDRVEEGLLDIVYHLQGERGRDTLRLLVIADAAMLCVYQLLDALVTATFRLRSALILIVGLKSCSLLSALSVLSLLAPVDGLLRLLPMPALPVSFVTLYLTVRLLLLLGLSLFRLSARETRTALPGSLHRFVQLPPSAFDSLSVDAASGGVAAASAEPEAFAPPVNPRRARHRSWHKRAGQSVWLQLRLLSFWLLVLTVKLLFDLYVLIPAVSRLTLSSLCSQPDAPLRSALSSTSTLALSVSSSLVCPLFLLSLQSITLLISIATSYISYVIVTSVVGVFVPAVLASTVKQERAAMATLLMAASTATVVCMAAGGLPVLLLAGAVLTCMALAVSEVWRGKGGWQESRQIVLHAGSGLQQAVPEAEEPRDCNVQQAAQHRTEAVRRQPREREDRKEDDEARREEAKEEQHAADTKASIAAAVSASPLTATPALLGMRSLLQPLFAHRLSLRDAAATWSAILLHLHNEDLLPLHHLSASSPLSLSSPAFLTAPSLSQGLPAVRARLLFFFRSLLDLRRMTQGRLQRVEALDSVSVIIPINSEAMLYSVPELLSDERARDRSSPAAKRTDAGISLLEFYVQKHRDEWDNLTERIGFTAAAASDSGSSSLPLSDSARRRANGDALLDAFILLHSGSPASASCPFTLSSFARYTEAVVLWTSYRGQTLARTVRGLSYTLTALQHRASVSPALSPSFQCQDKFQLLVAAQQYGRDARQREEMGRLMLLFPHLELVYDLDVRAWQEERVRNRAKSRPGIAETSDEEEQLGAGPRQPLPGLSCVPSEERQDGVDDAEVRKTERERASSLMQSSVQHLSLHLPLVLSAMQAVSAAAGDEREEEKKRQWEEKEAAAGDVSVLAAAVSACVASLPALLHSDDVCAVVWSDVLQEVEAQLHAMQQLELRLCQQELLSPSTQHALAPSNCLHFLHLHQHVLQQHSRVLSLLSRYRSTMLRLLGMWRQVRAEAALLDSVDADWRRAEHEGRRVQEIMQAGAAMPRTARGDNAGRAVLQLDAGLRRLSAGRQRLIAVCERQRQTVLSVMQSMQRMLETEHEEAASASPAFTLSTLAQLSGQLLAFSIAMEQLREAQQQHHAVLFLLHALCSLPPLLQVEQQRLLHWLGSSADVAQAMGGALLSAPYAGAVSELQQRQLELSSQLSKLHSLHAEGLRAVKHWMQANQRETEQPCSLPHQPAFTPQLASYSPLLPSLFSLYLSILHSHFLSSISAACRLLLQLSAEAPISASFSLQPLFSSLRAGTLFVTEQAVRAVCCCQRDEEGEGEAQRDAEERRLQPLVSAAHVAFLQLVTFPFHSVLVKHNTAASASSFRPLVLQSLPRRSPLLLGCLPASCPSSFPAPCTNPKSENQLHALPFARHALWQTIDMNQDLAFEDALKAPLFFASLQPSSPQSVPRFVLAGCSERVYSSSVSAVGRFMGLQDGSFTSICQRVLSYTDTRLHYGHPDVFDSYHARAHIGMSKASPSLNLSEDLYFGLDMIQRGAASAYVPFIRYAKGREVSLFNAATFEDKLSRGAALTLSSPDLYRLHGQLDLLSWLSLLFGAMGHYLFTFLFSHGIGMFVWLTLLQAVARITSEKIGLLHSVYAIPFLFHLGFAFGLPLLCQLVWEDGLWTGGRRWLSNLLLGSVYYLFQLRVKARGLEVGLSGGSGGYVSTGRGLCLYPPSLTTLYASYASSHFHHALHLLLLTAIFLIFLSSEAASAALLRLWAVLLACWSWLLAPALFAPSMQGEQEETSREAAGRRLWKEWEELQQWLRAAAESGGDGGDEAGWERWWWREKRQSLLQHGLRFHTTARCGWRRYVHHPHCHAAWSLLCCLLSHTPRLLLAFAMMMPAVDLLPLFALSAAFVASVAALCRAQHVLPLLLILLSAYCVVLTLSSLQSREGWTLPAPTLIPSPRILHTLMLVASLTITCTSLSSLAIAVLDARAVLRVHRGQPLSSRQPPAEYAALLRDWRLFAVWRLVYRYACPSIIAALHLVCRYVCCCCCDLHSWWLYELDMPAVREARRRRRRQHGQTVATGGALDPVATGSISA